MVIYKYTKEEKNEKGAMGMLNDEICKLRDKLKKKHRSKAKIIALHIN